MKKLMVYSRHPSHKPLREAGVPVAVRTLLRLGSITVPIRKYALELNSPQAIKNSASKFLMKQCFNQAGVKTADWFIKYDSIGGKGWLKKGVPIGESDLFMGDLPYPIISKSIFGSRGVGNTKLNSAEELIKWMEGKDMDHYIFEAYKTFTREYRIHVTEMGAFYACRKMLKRDTPNDKKFQRHDDNCVWYKEDNAGFDKPVNWNSIVADCIKALNGLGLDIGAFDIKVQSANDKDGKKRSEPDYIIIESCSAPSFGDVTLQKYIEEIPKLVNFKLNK